MDNSGKPPAGKPGKPSKIQHRAPSFGQDEQMQRPGAPPPPASRAVSNEPEPVSMVEASGPGGASKITAFGKKKRHEEAWSRTPNTTGTGAIHVKTFHCKMTDDALAYMDQVINEWLDAHPQYEVKLVSSSVGILTGKLKEPNLVCQVWV